MRRILRFAPAFFILAALAVFFASGAHRFASLEDLIAKKTTLQSHVQSYGWMGGVGFMLIYAGLMAIGAPGASVMAIVSGAIFGPWLGAPMTMVSATLGGTAFFLAAKTSLRDFFIARGGVRAQRLSLSIQDNAIGLMLFLRISPLFPFPLVNLAAALAGLRLNVFAWTTFVGLAPAAMIYNSAGSGLDKLAQTALETQADCLANASQGDFVAHCALSIPFSAIASPSLLLTLLALSALTLAPVILRHRRLVERYAKING